MKMVNLIKMRVMYRCTGSIGGKCELNWRGKQGYVLKGLKSQIRNQDHTLGEQETIQLF